MAQYPQSELRELRIVCDEILQRLVRLETLEEEKAKLPIVNAQEIAALRGQVSELVFAYRLLRWFAVTASGVLVVVGLKLWGG